MFKKRSKRPENTTSRPRSASGAEEGEGHEGDSVVQDLLALRRMKAAEGAGIQADKLNSGPQAGPSSSKKRKLAPGAAVDSEQELAAAASVAPMESLAKKNNFTQQMNLIDVDKHMMDYIESEMKKRQGQGQGGEDAAQADKKKDPRDELYAIDEKYRLKEKPCVFSLICFF